MNHEVLFDESVDTDDDDKLEKSIELTMNEWVYFFIFEKEGVNTPVSTEKVEYLIPIGKDKPINIPPIKDIDGVNAVMYFPSDFAMKCAEFNCKVAKTKDLRASNHFRTI